MSAGECRCGKVRLRAEGPPLITMACHCRGCQKLTSSAYSLSALTPEAGFEVTAGEAVVGRATRGGTMQTRRSR